MLNSLFEKGALGQEIVPSTTFNLGLVIADPLQYYKLLNSSDVPL